MNTRRNLRPKRSCSKKPRKLTGQTINVTWSPEAATAFLLRNGYTPQQVRKVITHIEGQRRLASQSHS